VLEVVAVGERMAPGDQSSDTTGERPRDGVAHSTTLYLERTTRTKYWMTVTKTATAASAKPVGTRNFVVHG
jgi:hypothetical protein